MMKKIISLILATVVLTGLLAFPAAAAGGDPVNPTWSGATATWQPPAKETSHYFLALYLDGNYLSDYTTPNTSYDFSDTMKNAGPGDYSFSVMAVYEDTNKSNVVYSDTFTYLGEGHPHPMEYVAFRYATCTENGVKEHYECPACGKYFWDSMGNDEIADKSEVVLAANGHDWGEWTITKNPTTTAEGEAKRVCAENPDHVEVKALPKLKSESETATAPPATEKTTASTQPATQPTTVAETSQPTHNALGKGLPNIDLGDNTPSTGAWEFFGLPVYLFWIIIGAAVFLFVVAPAVIIPIVIVNSKKKKK